MNDESNSASTNLGGADDETTKELEISSSLPEETNDGNAQPSEVSQTVKEGEIKPLDTDLSSGSTPPEEDSSSLQAPTNSDEPSHSQHANMTSSQASEPEESISESISMPVAPQAQPEAVAEKDESSLPADLVQIIKLQESLILSQLSALHRLSEQHLITSKGTHPITGKTGDLPAHLKVRAAQQAAEPIEAIVRPSQLEIKFVHLLDEAGGLSSKASAREALKLMETAEVSSASIMVRSVMLTALRRTSRDRVRLYFADIGGFKMLARWLLGFIERENTEAVDLVLRTLIDLPVHDACIRDAGLGKLVKRIMKGQEAVCSTQLASKVLTHWQVFSRARKMCGIDAPEIEPAAESRTNKRPIGAIKKKKDRGDALGDVLGGETTSHSLSEKARQAREAKRMRIAKRQQGEAGGTATYTEATPIARKPVLDSTSTTTTTRIPRTKPAADTPRDPRVGRQRQTRDRISERSREEEEQQRVEEMRKRREREEAREKAWARVKNMMQLVGLPPSAANDERSEPFPNWMEPRILNLEPALDESEVESHELNEQTRRTSQTTEVHYSRDSIPSTPQDGPVESIPRDYRASLLPLFATGDVTDVLAGTDPLDVKLGKAKAMLVTMSTVQRDALKAEFMESEYAPLWKVAKDPIDDLPVVLRKQPREVLAFLADHEHLLTEVIVDGHVDHPRLDRILSEHGVRMSREEARQKIVALEVEFKRGRKERFSVHPDLAEECSRFTGPFHIWVESSPGEDLGRVIRLLGPNKAGDLRGMKRAIRLASDRDRNGFKPKAEAERKAIEVGNRTAREMQMPIVVDDAEFQFDKKKLTLFFSATLRVDFREFVKRMGAHWKTFVWMARSDGRPLLAGSNAGPPMRGFPGGGPPPQGMRGPPTSHYGPPPGGAY